MATPRVLIVENEQIVAEDIRECLSGFGYEVVDNVGNGEKALQVAEKTLPDLVLMDINLDGDLDGTQVAQKLRNLYGIPVIYLTGYADDQTLKKAKSTVPLGFILKPFDERELRSAIEIALYRKEFEKNLVADSEWRKNAIESFDDGVIATDKNNCIKFMNCAAERITGWFFIEAHEKPLGNIFSVKRSDVSKIITKNGDVKHSNQKNSIRISNLQLIQSDGISEVTVNIIAHPILGPSDEWMGFTIIIRDVGIRKDQTENVLGLQQKELLHEKMEALHDLVEGLAHGINNSLCGSVGFLELLRQNGQIEEEFARWADMAISGCQNDLPPL